MQLHYHPDVAGFSRLRPAARLALLGELLLQGKNNLQAPWLGIAAFLSVAVLLTLLIFIGEAVRDAFDPSKAV